MRVSVDGFADSEGDEVAVATTSNALEIAALVNYDVNNSYDILLFFQKSQNADGGFGYKPGEDSDWNSTVAAVRGLSYLNKLVNASQIRNWKIQQYMNDSSYKLLYTNVTINNVTAMPANNNITG